MNRPNPFIEGFIDCEYLFWVWFALALAGFLILLAGLIGVDMIRDWRFYNRSRRNPRSAVPPLRPVRRNVPRPAQKLL